jgi:hypothetical protein
MGMPFTSSLCFLQSLLRLIAALIILVKHGHLGLDSNCLMPTSLFTLGHFMSQLHHYIPINSFTHGHLCLNCFILVPISLLTFGHFMCQLCHYIPNNSFTCGHLRLNCFVLVHVISFIRMCHHVSIVSLRTHCFVHIRMCHVSSAFNRCPLFHSHMPGHLLSKFAWLGAPLLH